MPATAGRVPMPNGNRLSVSDSLKTHDVWQKSVGYDPYAGSDELGSASSALPEVGEINSSAKGLFRLAQLTGNSSTLAPGACKKCGQVGHLYFQCRNYMSTASKKEEIEEALAEEEEDPPSDAFASSDSEDSDEDGSQNGSDESSSDSSGDSDSDSDSSSSRKKKKKKRKQSSKKDKKSKKSKKEKKAKGKSKKKRKT
mmetsp:Transcript_15308/g.42272  ORF Transcript_15308/g.42272 Transcript_15308/m.42272 type:complete len:198 (-) Transcript_15308:334-927(-)